MTATTWRCQLHQWAVWRLLTPDEVAIARPPGHFAESGSARGFFYLNNSSNMLDLPLKQRNMQRNMQLPGAGPGCAASLHCQ